MGGDGAVPQREGLGGEGGERRGERGGEGGERGEGERRLDERNLMIVLG